MASIDTVRARLDAALGSIGPVAVAVSGGVDSMTLAHVARALPGAAAVMYHALSPAVPAAATERVRAHAGRGGWRLEIINAEEMSDPRYLENPVNRCFFCKSNLYSRISGLTGATIISGTNTDDLGDFRPGLAAARDHRVRHPYVEAGIAKADVRRLAGALGLDDLAALPAAPCLSSRIETGLRVTTERLALIEDVETALGAVLGAGTLRCRVRHSGVVVELDEALLARAGAAERTLVGDVLDRHGHAGSVSFEPYRRGSAFLATER